MRQIDRICVYKQQILELLIIFKQSDTMQSHKPPIMVGSASPESDRRKKIDQKQVQEYPYGSILFLIVDGKIQRYYGTGSFLLNQKTNKCKHIITCAHNFVFYQFDNYVNYSSQSYYLECYFAKYQKSEDSTDLAKLIKMDNRLNIQKVYLHPKYLPARTGPIIPVVFDNDETLPKDVKNSMNIQRFYDIAVIELKQEIDVPGFLILDQPIKLSQLTKAQKQNIYLTGFPVRKDSLGVMYAERVGDKLDIRKFDQCIYTLKDNKGRQILRHTLSSGGGNSGSPIYFPGKEAAILLGIHTTGLGNDEKTKEPIPLKQFEFNNATDIYYSEVYDWLKNEIEGCIKESFLK